MVTTRARSIFVIEAMVIALILCLAFPAHAKDLSTFNLNIGIAKNLGQPATFSHYPSNDYMSLYGSESGMALKIGKQYPFGLVRFKVDKTLRVRGWQVGKNIYFGQAKVGKKWGLGLVVDRGNHYYGINHRGLSYLKKF